MRKWITLSLLLAVVAFAATPRPPRIDPQTGLPEEMVPERVMQKQPGEPSLEYLARQAEGPWAETDAQWDPDVRLTNNSIADYLDASGRHTVVVDPQGRVHVVWFSDRSPGANFPQIYYKRYYPASGWTQDTCISADVASNSYCLHPAVCVDSSGNVHAVWSVYTLAPPGYYIGYKMCTPASSGNGGWDPTTTRITKDTLDWCKSYPSIEASPNGHIHVVYYNYAYSPYNFFAIGYKEKIGTTWEPRVWVDSGSTSYYRYSPSVAADRNNNIHVTWYGYSPGTPYYQVGYRGRFGTTWTPVQPNISGGSRNQLTPSIAVNPQTNHVHIVWFGYTPSSYYPRIIHKERLGTGSSDTFQLVGDTVSESGSTYAQEYPCITFTREGRGHVVWKGRSSGSPSYYQIRYNDRAPDSAWGTPETLTNYTSDRYDPSINNGGNSSNPNDLHVVWQDQKDGNYEIYYKHGHLVVVDVQPTQIVAPIGEVDSGAVISPRVKVRNNGAEVASFYTRLYIGDSYNQAQLVDGLNPGEERTIGFPNWTVPSYGVFPVRCTTELTGDMIPENDLLADSCWAVYRDVAVNAIVTPTGTIVVGTVVTPKATVQNLGAIPATFDLHFEIRDETSTVVYDEIEVVTLDPGVESTYAFSTTWTAQPAGSYTARATAVLTGDVNPSNDQQVVPFTVRPRGTPGWSEKPQVPGAVKDGAFLAFNPDNGLIYAARGNKSGDFYSYDPNADSVGTWTTLTAIPATEGRLPSKGANGCYGDGYVYATIGNNTQGFLRYSVADNSWEPLKPVPLGPSNKKVKGGTDMVYVVQNDTGYVYLLKGYKTEFYRYNVAANTWESLPPAPAGSKPKWDKGSWLVYDDDNTLYAHKAKYSELWTFDLLTLQWGTSALPGIPIPSTKTGKNKKSKNGSDGAYYNGYIYALKGGNTCEWWRFKVAATAWLELDPMPEIGSTGRKKRVKAGGALTEYGTNPIFFALKGAKTQEFWRYYDSTVVLFASQPERSGVMAEKVSATRFGFSIAPNPVVKGYGILSYSVPQPGPVGLVVFDVTGREVLHHTLALSGTGTHHLDLRSLAAGVYLVKLEGAGYRGSQKLIVR